MKTKRICDILTIVLFLAVIFGFLAGFLIKEDVKHNGFETKELQTFPSPVTADSILHGVFAEAIDEYFCDQFPMRKSFLSLKANLELALGKGENGGIIKGENGVLAVKNFRDVNTGEYHDFYSAEHVKSAVQNLNSVEERLSSLGVDFTAVLPPRTVDVAASALDYPRAVSDSLNELINETAGDFYLPLTEMFQTRYDAGEYVYYRTDHHWTALGAYYAYAEIMKSFGEEAYPLDYFTFETASDSFFGTTWRNSAFYSTKPDSLAFARFSGDEDYRIEIYNMAGKVSEEHKGFYDRSYLEGLDKYSSYLYGKQVYFKISKEAEPKTERETLLVFKDSFAHCLLPYLSLHYDIVVYDLDADSKGVFSPLDISGNAEALGVDKVLLVYNLENVISTNRLLKVR